jgi:hypothetical protein
MPDLTATFDVTFLEPLLIRMPGEADYDPQPHPLELELQHDRFLVEIQVISGSCARIRLQAEPFWVTTASHARVFVTRNEAEPTPEVRLIPGGGRDCTPRSQYLLERRGAYAAAAQTALDRVFAFFRYELGHPLVAAHGLDKRDFANPLWTGAEGELVWNRVNVFVAAGSAPTRLYGRFGVIAFGRDSINELQHYVEDTPIPSLPRELLAHGRDAIAVADYRRAVLDLATACEVAVKSTLALRVPQDPGRGRRQGWIELLGEPCRRVFGTSFAEVDPASVTDLDQMRRCRNQIAHQGRAEIRIDGQWVPADLYRLERWWNAAVKLLLWLEDGRRAD